MASSVDVTALGNRSDVRTAIGVVSVCMVILAWEIAPRIELVPASIIPPFSQVLANMPRILSSDSFWASVRTSSVRWSAGYGLGSCAGIALGVAMARSALLFRLIDPFLVMLYPVPKAALVLVLVIWFGSTGAPVVLVVSITALLPVVVSTFHAAQGVDHKLLWSARALGRSRIGTLLGVVLPASAAGAISGAQIGIGISLFTLLSAELIIRQDGIGAIMFSAWDNGQFTTVWSVAGIVATTGFVLDWLFRWGVARALPWTERLH